MTAEGRAARTAAADARCASAYAGCGGPDTGVALVAVGGYGRGELAPYSDLDVVLVHDDDVDPGPLAGQVWYPLWDTEWRLDHSVRSMTEMTTVADADLKVALGLLDARHLAGDPNLTLRLRTALLAAWRLGARRQLPALRELVLTRHRRVGELAHLAVPDLKEAEGGLRDATVLRALVATWLVDVPHGDLERCRTTLLDLRDAVHDAAGRPGDRVPPELWPDLARLSGLPDTQAAQRQVRELGRRLTHLSRLVWRRVDAALARPAAGRTRRPALTPLASGVALAAGEVVLDRGARPTDDPLLLLRAAAAAAERDVMLAPATAARLVRDCPPLPAPWPREARDLLVRLLGAGPGLLPVWETLEETGALAGVLPEWERIRLLPHASPVHRFTVDRHLVETCVEASRLIRAVSRPDVLLVAALLHDIGKGGLVEHSVAGEPVARAVVLRLGFDSAAAELVAGLVRWHLLLASTATGRDHEDPATVELITSRLRTAEAVTLLLALSEADARATAPKAWSPWRAGLVRDLARRAVSALDVGTSSSPPLPAPAPPVVVPPQARDGRPALTVAELSAGSRVTVVAPDRVGLLADVAAVFALHRLPVRAARAWDAEGYAVSVWDLAEGGLDAAALRERLCAVADRRVDLSRLRRVPPDALAPAVEVRADASDRSTVLEVRTADRPGVVHVVCATLADLDVAVRSAHIDTLGPQAVDVFYLQEPGAGALCETRAAAAASAVRAALSTP